MTYNNVKPEKYSDEDWLTRFENERTQNCAITSLKTFDHFCQKEIGLNGKSKDMMIQKYSQWFNQEKPDIRSICLSLDKFVRFMTKDHKDIVIFRRGSETRTFEKKTSQTIRLYFSMIKNYLRVAHGIKLTTEDIKDFVRFPKKVKERRVPITLSTLKLVFGKCDPERRALYYVLISSGMRLGEGLSLKKENFSFDENPIRVRLRATDTKTQESRESFISSEAYERLKPILSRKNDGEYLFHDYDNIYSAVKNEVRYFTRLREKLGLSEKYPDSRRYLFSIHSMRAYFHTKASQRHGTEYANALDGHTGYLEQYHRLTDKEKGDKYLQLEPDLLIESTQSEANKTKDQIISSLEKQMKKLEKQVKRMGFNFSISAQDYQRLSRRQKTIWHRLDLNYLRLKIPEKPPIMKESETAPDLFKIQRDRKEWFGK